MKPLHHITRQIILKIILTSLAGCANAPSVPQVVQVPVYTSCVAAVPAKPKFEFGSLAKIATDGDKILALARDWPLGRAYELQLEAIIEGCK